MASRCRRPTIWLYQPRRRKNSFGGSYSAGIAVTGSVNQNGEIQAIGGINQKIEGFYDVCRLKGITGNQGVLIPKSNLRNLMLRPDVVQAVKDGKFHIYAVNSIDEGIEAVSYTHIRAHE